MTDLVYQTIKTGVKFRAELSWLQEVYDRAEAVCAVNRVDFAGREGLIEGSYYRHLWLETQPMAGEMYARRDAEVGLNNQLFFIERQAENGRLPGMISRQPVEGLPGMVTEPDGLTAYYGWLQGFCLALPAYLLSYTIGRDPDYLQRLYDCLKRFDDYLWTYRDSDGDGCLESWCVWDTGEDNCSRFFEGSPEAWPGEKPPTGLGRLPYESMDFMGYSCQCRETLALLSRDLGNGEEVYWRQQTRRVRQKIRSYLWDEEKQACYDRDCDNRRLDTLLHNNLRVMYSGGMEPDMADGFVQRHLLNPAEFWTKLPLPSIARNDPMYRNSNDNNWSGPPQGLTYQRAVQALMRYGYHRETVRLGRIWLEVCRQTGVFAQQYDPETWEPSVNSRDYGPSALAALEYISLLYGILPKGDRLIWSCADGKTRCITEQRWGDAVYRLETGGGMQAYRNDEPLFTCSAGVRVVTDFDGGSPVLIGIEKEPVRVLFTSPSGTIDVLLPPNGRYPADSGEPLGVRLW